MSGLESDRIRSFSFEGQFLGFIRDEGKPKYLRLGLAEQEVVQIKLAKHLRSPLALMLQPGDSIQVQGTVKASHTWGTFKFKADQVMTLAATSHTPAIPQPPLPAKARILVCQKSGCLKRGANHLLKALEVALRDRGLDHQIKIERTSCLKRCSSAPNLVVMPGKNYYCRLHPREIPGLLERHYHCPPAMPEFEAPVISDPV